MAETEGGKKLDMVSKSLAFREKVEAGEITTLPETIAALQDILGVSLLATVIQDGLQSLGTKLDQARDLVESVDGALAGRLAELIKSQDPDAGIRFDAFKQWNTTSKKDTGSFRLTFRGNLPSNFTERLQAEVERMVEETVPGVTESPIEMTVRFKHLPPESDPKQIEGSSGETTGR